MSNLTVTTPFNIDLEFKVAPFIKRVSATLIDIGVICAYAYVFIRFILTPLGLADYVNNTTLILMICVPASLYHLLMEVFFNGQSIGKKALGLKVMDKQGNEPTLSQYLVRWILGFSNYILFAVPYIIYLVFASGGAYIMVLLFVLFFYLPDVLSVAVTNKSQRLGDLAAGTVLIDQKSVTGIHETIYLEIPEENYHVQFPDVMRLSDRDINGIRNLLSLKQNNREMEHYMIEVSMRIKEVLSIQSDLVPRDFLQQLLQDYNYLTRK